MYIIATCSIAIDNNVSSLLNHYIGIKITLLGNRLFTINDRWVNTINKFLFFFLPNHFCFNCNICIFIYFRFYSHDSIFLHGGLDRPGQETRAVVGQQVNVFMCYSFNFNTIIYKRLCMK